MMLALKFQLVLSSILEKKKKKKRHFAKKRVIYPDSHFGWEIAFMLQTSIPLLLQSHMKSGFNLSNGFKVEDSENTPQPL